MKTNPKTSQSRILNKDGTFNVVTTTKRGVWGDLYHGLMTMSWLRLLGSILIFYFAINLAFAVLYCAYGYDAISGTDLNGVSSHFWDAFFFSVQTFATIGYGQMAPVGILPNITVTIEAIIGMLTLALATGLVFARFSRPSSKILFSQVALITRHNGKPCLSFRMANGRYNKIVQATVEVTLTREETTAEGQRFRKNHTLPLVRQSTPLFSATWTLFHNLDETSVLKDQTPETLKAAKAEIVVSVTGLDGTSGQTIHSITSYTTDEVIWNAQFADMITRHASGAMQIDVSKISDYLPL